MYQVSSLDYLSQEVVIKTTGTELAEEADPNKWMHHLGLCAGGFQDVVFSNVKI